MKTVFAIAALCFVSLSCSLAEEFVISPSDDWFSLLSGNSLKPGDIVTLQEGVYADPRRLTLRHRGREEAPITIRGEAGKRVVFTRPDAKQNTFNLEGAEFLCLRDIEITGGSAAIRIGNPDGTFVRGITLTRLHIHNIGGVAITCNSPGITYENMHFSENHIHDTSGHGEAFYLGGNNDKNGNTTAVFCNSRVERNYIHDLNGAGVSQGDGIEIKDGSFGNVVRDNVIHDTKYPGITVYGTDGNAQNIVENNAIWNTGDHGIQVAAEAIVRKNLILATGGDGIRSQNHQSATVGELEILDNTILKEKGIGIRIDWEAASGGSVRIEGNTISAPETFRVPEDAPFSLTPNEVVPLPEKSERESRKEEALRSLGRN